MDKFVLKFIWLDKTIAVSLDQRIGLNTTPLSGFYFWPQKDAWEEMKDFLESQPWISQDNSIGLLNIITEVINYWQEMDNLKESKDINLVRKKFPACLFI